MVAEAARERRQHQVVHGAREVLLHVAHLVERMGQPLDRAALGRRSVQRGRGHGAERVAGQRLERADAASRAACPLREVATAGERRAAVQHRLRARPPLVARQLERRRRGPRQVGMRGADLGVGIGRREHGGEVGAAHAVQEAVVDLGQQGELLVAVQSLDDPQLPEGPAAVEGKLEDPRGLALELLGRAGLGQSHVAHVVVEIETRIVHPHRPAAETREAELLPIARDQVEHASEGRCEALGVDPSCGRPQRACLDDLHGCHVHRGRIALGDQEQVVARLEALGEAALHAPPPSPTARHCIGCASTERCVLGSGAREPTHFATPDSTRGEMRRATRLRCERRAPPRHAPCNGEGGANDAPGACDE